MANVEIYTSDWCPFCTRAKKLLSSKGVDFTEINVGWSAEKKRAMIERADGRRTVPQIFIDDVGVGGSDELAALDRAGKLDEMLSASA